MSLASIEARASALMSLHKEELTRALAHFEHLAGVLIDEVEEKVKALVDGVVEREADEPKSAEPVVPQAIQEPVVVAQEPAHDEQQQQEASTGELQAQTGQGESAGEPGGASAATEGHADTAADNHEEAAQ